MGMLESLPRTQPTRLQEIYPHASEEALDLLRQCLQFNPLKRITTEQALNHPYVSAFHNEEEEIVCDHVIKISIDDDHKYSISEYRNVLYQEIVAKKKESRRKAKERKPREKRVKKADPSGEEKKEKRKDEEKREILQKPLKVQLMRKRSPEERR